ncbi:uncharacterized protein LOC107465925 [Arachis duranensis]|uniref:Uncharacterized protein LOC107465925 n=1 Tax=Arachis duranensis TaxID=130453 RepID=A0A6P4BID6_ARADU|nr:uncharacterized protein LOC107465925 [Arachis duranensis]
MRAVASFNVKSFAELVNKSRVVEDRTRKNATTSTGCCGYHNRGRGARSFATRHQNFNRGGYAQQRQHGRATFQGNNNNKHQGRRYRKQPQNDLTFMRNGSFHTNTPCKAGLGHCYSCRGAGHEKANRNAGRAQQQGHAYDITADDAAKSDTLIRGKCEIGCKVLTALYDIGASHSFIDFDKAAELGLKVLTLSFYLHVHTLASKTVVTKLGYQGVPFRWKTKNLFMILSICQ